MSQLGKSVEEGTQLAIDMLQHAAEELDARGVLKQHHRDAVQIATGMLLVALVGEIRDLKHRLADPNSTEP